MKRITGLLVVLLISLFLVGCGGSEKGEEVGKSSTKDLSAYQEMTEKLGEEILSDNVDVLRGKLSENLKKQLSEEDLIKQVKELLGSEKLIERTKVEVKEDKGLIQTLYEGKMTSSTAFLTLVYNKNMEVEGIFYNSMPSSPEGLLEDERKIQVGDEPLDGILKIGAKGEDSPLVILVPGSGPQDMDETIFQRKPLKDLADGLAKKGISSIRYHKRTKVYPKSFTPSSTIEDEYIKDLEWVLAHRKEFTSSEDIYLLGHSQGGMIIPSLVDKHPEIKGLILMGSTPRRFIDVIYDQMMEQTGEEKREEAEKLYEALKNKKANPMLSPAYLESLDRVEGPTFIKEVTIPVLILQGEEDFQVKAEKDFEEYKKLLGDHKNVQFILYPKLNHLFMETKGLKSVEDYYGEGHVAQKVMDDISNFIHQK